MTQELVILIFGVMTIGSIVLTIIYSKWLDKEERTKEKNRRNGTIKYFKIVNR